MKDKFNAKIKNKLKNFYCRFCKDVILAKTDGTKLYFPVFDYLTAIEIKKPMKYFPLRCGRCGEETLWRGKSID